MLEAIATAQQAIAADPSSLSAHGVLAGSYEMSRLFRWGQNQKRRSTRRGPPRAHAGHRCAGRPDAEPFAG